MTITVYMPDSEARPDIDQRDPRQLGTADSARLQHPHQARGMQLG